VYLQGAHLVGQVAENAPLMIATILDSVATEVSHIDVYCAYYAIEYVSLYGQSEAQKLSPPVFVKKTQGAFPHICAWWYSSRYAQIESPLCLEIDFMQTPTTPAWRDLSNLAGKNVTIEFYYGGDECNPIISTADLVLKLIRIYHHGTVEGRSLLQPLHDKCKEYANKRKLWFHNLGSRGFILKATAPDLPIQAHTQSFIKHPIFFYYWNSGAFPSKNAIASALPWSPIYNALAFQAFKKKGGIKSFSPTEDIHVWNAKEDFMTTFTKQDQEQLKKLESLGYTLPKIIDPKELIASAKF